MLQKDKTSQTSATHHHRVFRKTPCQEKTWKAEYFLFVLHSVINGLYSHVKIHI